MTDVKAETKETKQSVGRGPSYPYFNLKTAIEKSRALFVDIGRYAVGTEVVIGKLGYSAKSSSASKALAALRAFGILEDTKVDNDDRIRFSERGLDIVVDHAEGSAEWTQAVRAAAIAPKMHNELWSKYEGQIPPDEELKRYLVRVRSQRFHDDAAATFIEEFRETLDFAKMVGLHTIPGVDEKHDQGPRLPQVADYVQWTSSGVDRFTTPKKIAKIDGEWAKLEGSDTGVPMSQLSVVDPPVVKTPISGGQPSTPNPFTSEKPAQDMIDKPGFALERSTLDEGAVMLQWPDTLSKDSVLEFEYWIQGVLRRAKRKAGIEASMKPAE